MRKVREVLRLRFELGCSQRQIQASTGLSKGSVCDYLKRATAAGLAWDAASSLTDAEVEGRLFRAVGRGEPSDRAPIDFSWVHTELRKAGVTLALLCTEYQEAAVVRADGTRPYQYSQFCDLYTAWQSRLAYSMRQVHRAGEKMFVDYSGKRPRIVDRETGEVVEVELFVAVLGASNYTYAEATRSQQKADFVASTIRALEYVEGVPEIVVPDQLRSAVSGPDRYDPDLNPTYLELAQHYGFAVIPARPRKPRDKAKVEGAVLIAQRWILACLRHRTFFSLDELNEAIGELLERLNTRPFQKLEGCRRSAFEQLDRPALKPLPGRRYEQSEWEKGKVHIDYHVEFEDRFYSVPCALIGARVEVRATTSVVEVLFRRVRVASHVRSYGRLGTMVTSDAHKPKCHSDYGDWPPERMLSWAASIGPSVRIVVEKIFARYPRPELGYRPFLALTRDAKTFGSDRLDAACARGLALAGDYGPTRKTVHAILVRNLDAAPLPEEQAAPPGLRTTTSEAPNISTRRRKRVITEETIHKLMAMKLHTMAKGLRELLEAPPSHELSFEEKMGMLVDREWTDRDNRRLSRRIKEARLPVDASLEDAQCDPTRGLDKATTRQLATCAWVRAKQNVIVVGATGVGKTFIGAALAQAACRQGFRALCVRTPRLLHDLTIARADGTYRTELQRYARLDVLVLDDFLIGPMKDGERRDLLEILEDRYGQSSTVVTSQLPTKSWHETLADPTIADAICDRLVHNAHLVALRGASMRKKKGIGSEST